MASCIRTALALAAVILTTSGTSFAGERTEVTSKVFGLDKSQVLEIRAKHVLISIATDEIVVSDSLDPANPLKSLSGTCGGSVETKDGTSKGGGSCLYSNPGGGKWLLTWDTAKSRGAEGSYQLVGIEGNAQGWKGGGKWGQNIEFPKGRYYQTWTGWIERP